MTEKDLDQIFELIEKNRNKYKIYELLSKEQIEHLLLPRNNIIYTFSYFNNVFYSKLFPK